MTSEYPPSEIISEIQMPNYNPKQENLKVIQSNEMAVRLGKRGGLVKSNRKTWQSIKYCSSKCPYSSLCPFMTASLQDGGLCVIKKRKVLTNGREVPIFNEIITTFFSLFEDGEQGLLKETLASIFKVRIRNTNASNDDLHEYIHTLIEIKKAFYGEKAEHPINIQINNNNIKTEFISRLEAERRMKHDIINTTAPVSKPDKPKDQDTGTPTI